LSPDLRDLGPSELEAAGGLLYEAFARAAGPRGYLPPWASAGDATEAVRAGYAQDREGAIAAEVDGRLVGVGFVRRRGEVATLGPLATAEPKRGVGSTLLDELISRADGWGCQAIRLYQDAWNPDSFALYAGRSFAVVDVVARIERPAGQAPKRDSSRGLEIAAFRPEDLTELMELDLRLTGLERSQDLTALVRLVARRRGKVVGFLGMTGGLLGPALALDVADLGGLVARALVDAGTHATARLSTAAPTAMLAALGLGFHVGEVGLVMSRGIQPHARPPQLYSLVPEVL